MLVKPPYYIPANLSHPQMRNCLMYLPLNDGYGTTALDLSGALTPADLIRVAIYGEDVDIGAGNWNSVNGTREFIQIGHKSRFRQNGTLRRIIFYCASVANLTEFYFTVWRKDGATYDRVGISENVIAQLSSAETISVDLSTYISGVQEGDFLGYRVVASGVTAFTVASALSACSSLYVNATADAENYDWEAQNSSANSVPMVRYMTPMDIIAIGDSIIAGHTSHYSYLETTATNDPDTTILSYLNTETGYSYQNMGIGGQTTAQIAARFQADVINLKPGLVIIEGGVADIIDGGISKATFLANYTTMLDLCQANSVIPVVIPILPWTDGTNGQMQTRDDWNTDLAAIVAGYSTAILVNCEGRVGKFRSGGDAGNLWDIGDAYDGDGIHYNAAGHEQIALEIADNLPATISKPSSARTVTIDGAAWIPGKDGFALQFDGSDDGLVLPQMVLPTNGTIFIRFRPDNSYDDDVWEYLFHLQELAGRYFIIYKREDNANSDYDNAFGITYRDGSGNTYKHLEGASYWLQNEWHTFTVTWEPATNTVLLYFDGLVQTPMFSLDSDDPPDGFGSVAIGYNASDQSRPFAGQIDSFRLFDRVLTPAAIANLEREPYAVFDQS